MIDVLLSVPEERREQAARLMCDGDADLLAIVTTALSAAAQEDLLRRLRRDSMTAGADAGTDTNAGASAPTRAITADHQPGATIGAYKLLERLGEGGFGVVYAAEQSSPIRRRVAVKVIKEGMDSRAVVARFEAERQALAMMDHPNIAKVFDAGATKGGRPYFVMELVRGVSITEYCEENRLSPRERIELMIPVCQAIQHAHQKGVIHRDIKPGNVLVSITDGKPVPKVIDFGVAKAMAEPLTDKTVYTAFRQFIGTPAYMSPEQILQSGVDVDTRSDVYALGVLMYELLAGSLPYDTEALLKLGLGAMQQAVRETEPPKPSTRLMTLDAGKRTSIAAARRLLPDKLTGALRGEVDWMVMKAVEKDRNRRYQSPSELAEDLSRYLAGEPVKASPPGGVYRARKFIRRNRVAVIVAGVAIGGLIATTIGTSIGLRREAAARATAVENERIAKENGQRANAERAKAEKSAKTANAALQFFPDVLSGANPELNNARTDVTVGEMLDKAVAAADQGVNLRGQRLDPEVEQTARFSIAGTYYGIGRYAEGVAQCRKGLELTERIFGPDSLETVGALAWLGTGLWQTGPATELEAVSRRQIAILKAKHMERTREYSIALNGLSLSFHTRGMVAEALAVDLERLAVAEQVDPPDAQQLAGASHEVALNMIGLGRAAEALPHIKRSIAAYESLGNELSVSRPLTTLGLCLIQLGRLEEAEDACRRSMEISDRLRGVDHPYPIYERFMLAEVLIRCGKLDEASQRLETAIATAKSRGPNMLARATGLRGLLLRASGQPAAAMAIYDAMMAQGRAAGLPDDSTGVLGGVSDYAAAMNDLGQHAEVIAKGEPFLALALAKLGPDPANTFTRGIAAEILRACEAIGDEASKARAAELRSQFPGLTPPRPIAPKTP